ncbi:hypothetical protein DQ04_09051010 [Trypanosoma grayi]|uniref:hypothetical protein n=1 Tax=Trypanosoma grayi TaxID=71804 RepID=UPI0004F4650B|nr:hypothetical protein DQ04_09051010 [Trypanosoma grayi]KEG07699.1 hypothetical protein DQ04_09051010 [Trypanosoma grayi]
MLAYIFFCILVALSSNLLCVFGDDDQYIECPESCNTTDEWCSRVFGHGGAVSSRNCVGSSFECTCNNASGITVTRTSEGCTWDRDFNDVDPNGSYCFPYTSRCPTSCADISQWTIHCVADTICTTENKGFNFNCTTCAGRTYSVIGDNESCEKHYSSEILSCDPLTTCNGHGCCRKPDTALDACICFRDPVNGYWAQPLCSSCDDAYDPNKGGCTHPRPVIQQILSSIGSTWTMVLPNLAVLFLFVVLGVVRGECESDKSFQSTALRKTELSAVQVARRHQRGLFHSKYIPKRPAQSRCFLNEVEGRAQPRGPPAY